MVPSAPQRARAEASVVRMHQCVRCAAARASIDNSCEGRVQARVPFFVVNLMSCTLITISAKARIEPYL